MVIRIFNPLILIILPIIFVCSEQSLAREQESIETIREKIQQGWHRLKISDESHHRYSVQIEYIDPTPQGVRKELISGNIHIAPEHFFGDYVYQESDDKVMVGSNPSYTFRIVKTHKSYDWQLTLIGEGKDVKRNPALERALNSLHIYDYYPLSAVSGRVPENWLNDPGISITKVVRDDQGRYRVSYTTRGIGPPHAQPEKPYHLESIMTVDPKLDWCVLEIDQHGVGMTASYNMKREVARDGPHLICRRIAEKELYFVNAPVERSWMYDNYKYDVKDDPEIFYLNRYGLPEPMGAKVPEGSRTWIWLLAAAITAATLAILFSWLKRRRTMAIRALATTPSDRTVA